MTTPFVYLKYDRLVQKNAEKVGTIPHCDSNILHAPEDGCIYCNERPELQEARRELGINFTGHYDPDLELCPAEARRSLGTMERWGGNVIRKTE